VAECDLRRQAIGPALCYPDLCSKWPPQSSMNSVTSLLCHRIGETWSTHLLFSNAFCMVVVFFWPFEKSEGVIHLLFPRWRNTKVFFLRGSRNTKVGNSRALYICIKLTKKINGHIATLGLWLGSHGSYYACTSIPGPLAAACS